MDIKRAREELKLGNSIYNIPLKVCFYARVSTDNIDQLNSLENQKNYFEELINENNNWEYIDSYIDEGISGTSTKNRVNFLRMINDARNNKIDLILTKEISRFSRNTIDSIKYTELLLSYGTIVYFINDNLNTIYPDSEFRLTIMSSLAQDEVRKLSERVKFGINRMVKDRKLIGSSLTGYYKKDGKLYINPKESFIIKYLFSSYISNIGLNRISINLFKMGYFNSKGERYSTTTLAKFLTNPRYKGFYTAKMTEVIDYKTHKKKKLPLSSNIIEKDPNIPPIIDEKLWDKANKMYLSRKNKSSHNILNSDKIIEKSKYTCLIYCTKCNNYYIRQSIGTRLSYTWSCKTYKQKGVKECSSPIIKENIIDDIMINLFNNIFDKDLFINNFYHEYLNIINKVDNNNSEIIKINKLKKDKLIDLNINGIISNEELKERLNKLDYSKNISNNKININDIKLFISNKIINYDLVTYIKLFINKININKINNNRKHINIEIIFNYKRSNFNKEIFLY